MVPHSPEGTPQSVQDIDVVQCSTMVALDRYVVVDADLCSGM